ncbi:MAG: hypothetical protein ACD_58C00219G0001 [uncultured bacterium]|nr:MAG: hypothetical protein ACD_58C00219G0001 [uncultured bacterium]
MDQFDLYSKEVMKYFTKPKNIGLIKNADGIGTVGNPRCGDVMKVYLKIGQRPILNKLKLKTKNEKLKTMEKYIKDIKVQTLGCGAAIATSSIATEMVKGKSLEEALKLTNKEVAKALGGLPPVKMHCSLLAEEGIRMAIEDYRNKITKS